MRTKLKLRLVRKTALAVGAILAIFQLNFFIGYVANGQNTNLSENTEGGSLFLFLIPAFLMLITWISNKLGAVLLIIFPIVYLFLPEAKGQFDFWLIMNAPFILVGLMLLNYIYYNKYLEKKNRKTKSEPD